MKQYIELIAAIIMIGGLAGVFFERIKHSRGIGVRVIQFLAVLFVVPAIIILALEGILSEETTATLFGTIIGYILSGIGKDEAEKKSGGNIP